MSFLKSFAIEISSNFDFFFSNSRSWQISYSIFKEYNEQKPYKTEIRDVGESILRKEFDFKSFHNDMGGNFAHFIDFLLGKP